jgi:hypothetical protein
MHYIIGTEITMATVQSMGGSGPQPVNAHQVQRKARNDTPFAPGVKYTLYNIKPVQEGIEYQFVGDNNDVIPMVFTGTKVADNYISRLRNEPLPNYDMFYRGRSF